MGLGKVENDGDDEVSKSDRAGDLDIGAAEFDFDAAELGCGAVDFDFGAADFDFGELSLLVGEKMKVEIGEVDEVVSDRSDLLLCCMCWSSSTRLLSNASSRLRSFCSHDLRSSNSDFAAFSSAASASKASHHASASTASASKDDEGATACCTASATASDDDEDDVGESAIGCVGTDDRAFSHSIISPPWYC